MKLLLVAAGGAFGCVGRYLVSEAVQRAHAGAFPLGVLAANVAGSVAYGFLAAALARWSAAHDDLRLLLMVGFLGGFTTFSAYAFETAALAEQGAFARALANVALSNVLCVAGAWAGWAAAARLVA